MENRRLRASFYPQEDEPIEQSNILKDNSNIYEHLQENVLSQNYLNSMGERKVSFTNPRKVSFNNQAQDREQFSNKYTQDSNHFAPNFYHHPNDVSTKGYNDLSQGYPGKFENFNMSNIQQNYRNPNFHHNNIRKI